MSFLRVTRRPMHCYVAGRRVHHFWIGLIIVLSDLPDWRVWCSDLRKR